MLSGAQFRFFDCNKLAVLSVGAGAVTLLLVYGVGEVVFDIATSLRPHQAKLVDSTVVILVGGVLVVAAGFVTLMTHLCP